MLFRSALQKIKENYNSIYKLIEEYNSIAKIIDYQEFIDNDIYVEVLFEYSADTLSNRLKNMNNKESIEMMKTVSSIMQVINEKKIYLKNLSPDYIFSTNKKVKILHVGYDGEYISKNDELRKSETTQRLPDSFPTYLPPEMFSKKKYDDSLIDSYSWGVIFYQCITRCDEKALRKLIDLKKGDSALKVNISNLEFGDGIETKEISLVKDAIAKAFVIDPAHRRDFWKINYYLKPLKILSISKFN